MTNSLESGDCEENDSEEINLAADNEDEAVNNDDENLGTQKSSYGRAIKRKIVFTPSKD